MNANKRRYAITNPRSSRRRTPAGSPDRNLTVLLPNPCGFSTPRTRMPCLAYVDTPSRGVTLGSLDSAHTYAMLGIRGHALQRRGVINQIISPAPYLARLPRHGFNRLPGRMRCACALMFIPSQRILLLRFAFFANFAVI